MEMTDIVMICHPMLMCILSLASGQIGTTPPKEDQQRTHGTCLETCLDCAREEETEEEDSLPMSEVVVCVGEQDKEDHTSNGNEVHHRCLKICGLSY